MVISIFNSGCTSKKKEKEDVTINDQNEIYGHIADSTNDSAIENATVKLYFKEFVPYTRSDPPTGKYVDHHFQTTTSDEDGYYHMAINSTEMNGKYCLKVYKAGYFPRTQSLTIGSLIYMPRNISLTPAASIVARVVDEKTSLSVKNATVALVCNDRSLNNSGAIYSGIINYKTLSDEKPFRAGGFRPGRYDLVISAPGYETKVVHNHQINKFENPELVIPLKKENENSSRISVNVSLVFFRSDQPIFTRALIMAYFNNGSIARICVTDHDGTCKLSLLPDHYHFKVISNSYVSSSWQENHFDISKNNNSINICIEEIEDI